MTDAEDLKHAVILSGGGAYAAFEVGVLKALLTGNVGLGGQRGFEPVIYTGTSAGALNAAIMVAQQGMGASACEAVEYLENVWLNLIADSELTCGNGIYRIRLDPFRYLNPQCLEDPAHALTQLVGDSTMLAESFLRRTANFLNTRGPLQTRALEFVDISTWISRKPLERLVREIISLEAIRRSSVALRIVAADWETGEVKIFKNEDLTDDKGHDVIIASTALPGFFQPQYVAGSPYVDGSVVMNTPLRPAIKAGSDVLHVIYLDPDLSQIPLKVLENTYNTLDRTILINNATVINEDTATALWINEGLDVIERAESDELLSDEDARAFLRVAAQIRERIRLGAPYRKLILHRYHPHTDPGGGGLGVLNFNRRRVVQLMDQGFEETTRHFCQVDKCVVS